MSEVENLNMASRLELMMEMERRIEGRLSEEKVKLEKEVARLSKCYAALLKKHEEVDASLASALEREILSADLLSSGRELEKKAIRLKDKLNQSYAQSKTLKEENESLKKLNPVENKKKLEDLRRETKETKKVLSSLMADKKHLLEIIAGQKLELEKVSARGDTSSENYLYASKCKKYRVMGTAFTSDGRPYVKDDFNYRVLCMDSGASYVALVDGEKVYFAEVDDIPKDVITFIESSIRFDTASTI